MADKQVVNSGTPVFSNIIEKVSSALGSANEAVKSTVSNVSNKVTDTVSKSTAVVSEATTAYGLIMLVTVVVGIILFVIAYYLYRYVSTRLVNKRSYEVPNTVVPIKTNQLSKVSGADIPELDNGRRMSYSFWIYIYDLSKFSVKDDVRHVFHVGAEEPIGAAPVVYLDGMTNKLYFRFSRSASEASFRSRIKEIMGLDSNKALPSVADQNDYKAAVQKEVKDKLGGVIPRGPGNTTTKLTFEDAILIDLSTRGVVIDYVPLQRWVHVTVVVNETVNTGQMTVYLDGEFIKTVDSVGSRYKLSYGKELPVNFNGIFLEGSGKDIYIGGDMNSTVGTGFSGLISKLRFTNYDLNGREVKDIYVEGPVDNLTSRLGLPPYGVRSPIYRIGSNTDTSDL